jgi:hypothetical protein
MQNQQNYPQQPPPQQAPTQGAQAVRHIPIFVEGRSQPLLNTNASAANQEKGDQQQDGAFRKPSDYYPAGIQRIKSRDGTITPETPPFQNEPPPFKHIRTGKPYSEPHKPIVPIDEPTTPLGPPPGPIPMGYSPNHLKEPQVPVEPSSPLPPPPGPIPMGCTPNLLGFPHMMPTQQQTMPESVVGPNASIDKPMASQGNEVATHVTPMETKDSSQRTALPKAPTVSQPEQEKLPQKTNVIDSKNSAEPPTPNVIPIKVEHYDQDSLKRNSVDLTQRQPSPSPIHRQKSPTPAQKSPILMRKSPTPPTAPQKPTDPKVEKLQKIMTEIIALTRRIDDFKGSKKDKEYLYLDEMLTRHLIAMDSIEPEGRDDIRQLRKESIKSVNKCLSLLDNKVNENAAEDNKILSEMATQSQADKDNSAIQSETNGIETQVNNVS